MSEQAKHLGMHIQCFGKPAEPMIGSVALCCDEEDMVVLL